MVENTGRSSLVIIRGPIFGREGRSGGLQYTEYSSEKQPGDCESENAHKVTGFEDVSLVMSNSVKSQVALLWQRGRAMLLATDRRQ